MRRFLQGCGAFLTGYSDLCSRGIAATAVTTRWLDELQSFYEKIGRLGGFAADTGWHTLVNKPRLQMA